MSAGVLSQISFKKETDWGTAVVPDKSIAVRPTGGLTAKENIQQIQAIKGQLQKNYDAIKGKVAYEGSFTMDSFADYIGYFLLSALGTDTPNLHSSETIVYDHVFTETLPKPSLTIEQAQGESVYRYAGCIASGFKIIGKAGEMLEFQTDLQAKGLATATEISPAFTTVPAFNHAQLAVKIGGVPLIEVENFEINYKNGLEMVHAVGSVDPVYNSIKGGSEVTGKIEMYLDTTTLNRLVAYLAKTNESIELIATGTDTIGVGAHYALDILIPKSVYTTADTKITDDHNLLSIEFAGIYDTVTSKLLAVTLTNLLATY